MKKLILLALILFAKSAFAQKDTVGLNISFAHNTVAYERVFNVPATSKSSLYSNAGLWLAATHPYVEDTQLQLEDPILARVVGRVQSSTIITSKVLWETQYGTIAFNFTLQVDCKDNRYRIRVFNIEDMIGTRYEPIDNFMFALINSKSYTANNGVVLKTADLKQHFKALNIVINNVVADIGKTMTTDNSF